MSESRRFPSWPERTDEQVMDVIACAIRDIEHETEMPMNRAARKRLVRSATEGPRSFDDYVIAYVEGVGAPRLRERD